MKKYFLILLVGVILIAAIWTQFGERFHYYRFSSELWSQPPPKNRYYMARHVIDHHLLNGLTRQEMTNKLGAPRQDRGPVIHYDLGQERGLFAADGMMLDIYFDTKGLVSEVVIHPI